MADLARHLAAGPFHLALSAGYFGFYAHAGVLSALADRGLRPASWSGTSAGALIAALGAAGLAAEELGQELGDLQRRDFWDPGLGLGLLRGRKLERRIAEIAPVRRLEDCREPITISVLDLATRRLALHRRGDLARVVHASLAIFPLFMPVRLEGRLAADGGGIDRPALAGVPGRSRVLLHDLPSRSGRATRIPRDDIELIRLRVEGLPRLGPFHLERGPEAQARAREAARARLDGAALP